MGFWATNDGVFARASAPACVLGVALALGGCVEAAGDAAAGGPTKLSLTSSTGPAGTAGFVYKFAPNLQFDASYSIARVRTHLSADTAGVIRTTDISFGPQALVVAVGYSF